MPKKFLTILCLAASIGFGLAGSLLVTPLAQAQTAGAKVGEKVGKLLQDALNASKQGKNTQALAKLKEADAVSGKTDLEQLKIAEMYGYVYLQQKNYTAAAAAYERTLNFKAADTGADQRPDQADRPAQLPEGREQDHRIHHALAEGDGLERS